MITTKHKQQILIFSIPIVIFGLLIFAVIIKEAKATTFSLIGSTGVTGGDMQISGLTTNAIAFWEGSSDQLRVYTWNGSSWSLTGTPKSITGGNDDLDYMSDGIVAMTNDTVDTLATYVWGGSTWTQAGASTTIRGTSDAGVACITASTCIIATASTTDEYQTYTWSGSSWSTTGSPLTISLDVSRLAKYDSTHFVGYLTGGAGGSSKRLGMYNWNGSVLSQVGSLSSDLVNTGTGDVAVVNGAILVADQGTDKITEYSWDGSSFTSVGDVEDFASGSIPTITGLTDSGNDGAFVYIDSTNESLRFYQGPTSGYSGNLTGIAVGPSYFEFNYPVDGTETASRTIDFNYDYYLDTDFHSSSTFTHILLSACSLSYDQDDCEKFTLDSDGVITNTLTTVTSTVTLARDGYYLGMLQFWNGVSESVTCKWYEFWCDEERVETIGATTITFNSATTTLTVDFPYSKESFLSACDDTFFLGADAICKVIVFMFLPSENVLNKWQTLDNLLADKVPFAYFIQTKNELEALSAITGAEGDVLTVDLGSGSLGVLTVFDPVAIKADSFVADAVNSEAIEAIIDIFVYLLIGMYVWKRIVKGSDVDTAVLGARDDY